jgi:hypothetical protein
MPGRTRYRRRPTPDRQDGRPWGNRVGCRILIVLNFSFLTGSWWSVIPLVGWGIVLALHYLSLRRVERADARLVTP